MGEETLEKLKMDPSGGMPAAEVARAYVAAVEGSESGRIIPTRRCARQRPPSPCGQPPELPPAQEQRH